MPCSLSKTRVGGWCCHDLSQKPGSGVGVAMISLKNPGRGFVLPCSLSKTRVGGLCCLVRAQKPGSGVLCCLARSQKPGSGVCVAVFALKNCPCSLSKTLIVFPVVALKNPGRGLVLIVCTLKNPGRGFYVAVFSLKNPGRGYVTVFALKNPGRVDRVRSQKPTPLRVEDGVTSPLPKTRGFF